MIERESVKSVGAYLESQAEAMRQALAALIEIPSYRTQAEEGAPYGKGPAAALQEGMRLAQEQGLRTRLVENVMLEADLGEGRNRGWAFFAIWTWCRRARDGQFRPMRLPAGRGSFMAVAQLMIRAGCSGAVCPRRDPRPENTACCAGALAAGE